MRRKRKVLVRPITLEQARSYERARPNGLGVTAIAAVNGRGSYARRYARARRLLGGLSEEQQMVKSKRGRARRYGRNPWISTGPATSRWVSDKDYPRALAAQKRKAGKAKAATKRAAAAAKRAALKAAGKKPRRKPVSAARAMATRKARAHRANLRRARTYAGGKFKAVRAHFGPYATRDTYAYATKRGTLKKIPRYALLGFRSLAEMKRMTGKDAALKERIDKRISAFDKRRAGAAARIGGLFAPNRRRKPRVISFATWESEMKLGRGRRKAKSYSANKGRKVRRGRKTTKRRTTKRSKVTRRSKVARRRPVTTRRRRVVRRRPMTARRAHKSLKTMKRVYRKPRKVKRVSLRLYSRNAETAALTPNRRRRRSRRSRHYAANASRPTISLSRKFKRARKVKGFKFRGYGRNPFMKNAGAFKDQIMEALVVGSVAGAGFLAHRALTRLVTYKAPWFKDQIAKDALNPVPEMLAAAGVALIGVPLAAKFFPGKAKLLAAGMIADFIVLGVQKLLGKYDSNMKAYPYLAGMGSYYELPARRGYGEYVQAQSGFGRMTQAAAGFGRMTQAAAGMGRFQQAAAGFGQLTQAAAGVGEYVATDLEGIGDYIEVTPELTAAAETDNGIMPTLSEAEAALNVSEGANGIGGRVPARYTVDPIDQTAPLVEDENVDRAGMFAGRDGIFGPLQ